MESVVMLKPEEWKEFKADLLSQVSSGIESIKASMVERPISFTQAAEHLILTESGFKKRIQRKKFPAKYIHKKDGTLYFFPSELNEYIKSLKDKKQ